jgi:hypothetical protein
MIRAIRANRLARRADLLRAALLAAALAFTAAPCAAQSPAGAQPSAPVSNLSAEQWREDLRFMAAEMEQRHANLYHSVSRERFAAAVADLDTRIPQLKRNEIVVGMMRIAALVGDGHTRVEPRKDTKFGFPSLPLKLYLFEDGLYVRAARPDRASLVGARIEAIGGVPIEEAIRRVGELSSRDNAMGPKLFAPLYLNMPDILNALGMSARSDAAILTLRKGKRRWSETVLAAGVEPVWPPDTDASFMTPEGWVDARGTPAAPLWLEAPLTYHRFIPLPEQKALYVQLNQVTDVAGETLGQYGEKIRAYEESANPRAIVLDLRLNQGGNGNLRNGLVRALIKAEDEDTRLFVLTWRGTFSASEFILNDLDRLTGAIFIGEPASSKPSSYGDSYRMPLPNSGITVRSSIYWNASGQNRSPWTWLDIATPLTFADYVAGRDPALEAALSYTPQPALRDRLLAAATAGGSAAVRQALDSYRGEVAHRYQNLPVLVPQAAEALYASKHPQEALAVAQIAAEEFPDSVDAALVLAYIAESTGPRDVALRSAKAALALDRNNRVARSMVERMEAMPH